MPESDEEDQVLRQSQTSKSKAQSAVEPPETQILLPFKSNNEQYDLPEDSEPVEQPSEPSAGKQLMKQNSVAALMLQFLGKKETKQIECLNQDAKAATEAYMEQAKQLEEMEKQEAEERDRAEKNKRRKKKKAKKQQFEMIKEDPQEDDLSTYQNDQLIHQDLPGAYMLGSTQR